MYDSKKETAVFKINEWNTVNEMVFTFLQKFTYSSALHIYFSIGVIFLKLCYDIMKKFCFEWYLMIKSKQRVIILIQEFTINIF